MYPVPTLKYLWWLATACFLPLQFTEFSASAILNNSSPFYTGNFNWNSLILKICQMRLFFEQYIRYVGVSFGGFEVVFNYPPDTLCIRVYQYCVRIVYIIITFLLFCRFHFIAHINISPSYYRRRCRGSHVMILYYIIILSSTAARTTFSFVPVRGGRSSRRFIIRPDRPWALSAVTGNGLWSFFQLYLPPPGGVKVLDSIIIDYFMSATRVTCHHDYIVREI